MDTHLMGFDLTQTCLPFRSAEPPRSRTCPRLAPRIEHGGHGPDRPGHYNDKQRRNQDYAGVVEEAEVVVGAWGRHAASVGAGTLWGAGRDGHSGE